MHRHREQTPTHPSKYLSPHSSPRILRGKEKVTYPLQPRKMLVNINVPIHAGHPCQQADSLVEKALYWPETKFSPLTCLCPLPLQERQAVFRFLSPRVLCPVLWPFSKQLQICKGPGQPGALVPAPTAPTNTLGLRLQRQPLEQSQSNLTRR